MPTYLLQMTEMEKQNLLVFLGRTELKGTEAEAFVSLVTKISKAPVYIVKAEAAEEGAEAERREG